MGMLPEEPWQVVLSDFRVDALGSFLGRYEHRSEFIRLYTSVYFDDDTERERFEALMAGLAHCRNAMDRPFRTLRRDAAFNRAQQKRTARGYKPEAAADILRQKSFSLRESKNAQTFLLYGYTQATKQNAFSIDTWKRFTLVLSHILSLRLADPHETPAEFQAKAENVARGIRRRFNTHFKDSRDISRAETLASDAFAKVYATLHSAK